MNRVSKSFILSIIIHIVAALLLVLILQNSDKKEYNYKKAISIEIENITIPNKLDTMKETKKELVENIQEKSNNNEVIKEKNISTAPSDNSADSDIHTTPTNDASIDKINENKNNDSKPTNKNDIKSEGSVKQESVNTIPSDYYQPKTAPTISYSCQPIYPENLRRRNKQSQVTLQLLVSENGSVESVTILDSSGYGEMDSSAIDAAYNYKFTPAYNNYGNPVQCYATITIYFELQ